MIINTLPNCAHLRGLELEILPQLRFFLSQSIPTTSFNKISFNTLRALGNRYHNGIRNLSTLYFKKFPRKVFSKYSSALVVTEDLNKIFFIMHIVLLIFFQKYYVRIKFNIKRKVWSKTMFYHVFLSLR